MRLRRLPLWVATVLVASALAVGALAVVLATADARPTVPRLSGRPLAIAERTLEADGLRWTVVRVGRGLPAGGRPGTVLGQEPSAGDPAAQGSTVRLSAWLTVGTGPDAVVPGLVRTTVAEALDMLRARGLVAVVSAPAGTAGELGWTVASQSPARGATLPVGLGHVRLTLEAPPVITVLARIPSTSCGFVRGRGIHLVAAFVITSAQLRRAPIADGGPLGRQSPGAEWRACDVVGEGVDPSFGGGLVGPDRMRGPESQARARVGPRQALYVYYRGGSLAEVAGMPVMRFRTVEGRQPASAFPWLAEASS